LPRVGRASSRSIGGRPRVDVLNAGVPGYWPEAERLMLEHYGLAYSPDLVLVAFLPNDVLDTHRGQAGVDVRTGFLVQRGSDGRASPGDWLFVRSHLFRALLASASRVRDWTTGPRAPRMEAVDRDGAAREAAWVRIEQEYTRMAALASAHAARMAVVLRRARRALHRYEARAPGGVGLGPALLSGRWPLHAGGICRHRPHDRGGAPLVAGLRSRVSRRVRAVIYT
jgi:hypothetical protein